MAISDLPEINNIFLKFLNISDIIILAQINKNSNKFISNNKYYLKPKNFYNNPDKLINFFNKNRIETYFINACRFEEKYTIKYLNKNLYNLGFEGLSFSNNPKFINWYYKKYQPGFDPQNYILGRYSLEYQKFLISKNIISFNIGPSFKAVLLDKNIILAEYFIKNYQINHQDLFESLGQNCRYGSKKSVKFLLENFKFPDKILFGNYKFFLPSNFRLYNKIILFKKYFKSDYQSDIFLILDNLLNNNYFELKKIINNFRLDCCTVLFNFSEKKNINLNNYINLIFDNFNQNFLAEFVFNHMEPYSINLYIQKFGPDNFGDLNNYQRVYILAHYKHISKNG